MTYKHDTKAYLIVIKANRLNEAAMNLYHVSKRGEPTSHEMGQLQETMQEVGKAFDAWVMGGNDDADL